MGETFDKRTNKGTGLWKSSNPLIQAKSLQADGLADLPAHRGLVGGGLAFGLQVYKP